jgi:secreted PhoX family phosphatase
MKRRRFVVGATAATLSAGLALWFRVRGRGPRPLPGDSLLQRDPDGLLDLPAGFRYTVLERPGSTMSDGYRLPTRPDAMGCFQQPDGSLILMRNHELDRAAFSSGAYASAGDAPPEAFDAAYPGGVTRLVLDAQGKRISSNLVLTGTARNCAGGVSPWGWLTCEESVDAGHGYVFLCDVSADRVRPAKRISAYGRFLHEAVAIDPRTHAAYLTEDRAEGCLYRYLPNDRDKPFGPGRLQALMVAGSPGFAVGDSLQHGKPRGIAWVDVPAEAGERDDALRVEAQKKGAALVRRGEGIWFGHDGAYVTSTSGGPLGKGQVFHVTPRGDGGTIRLIAQADAHNNLDMPDNITVTPWGDLLVCEDNQRDEYLRLITRSGKVIPFAHNALSISELAGVCFSPDGRRLFLNIQANGLTLMIEGPFQKLALS